MKRLAQLVIGTSVLAMSVVAFAQASEFRKRIQEDLDSWKPEFISSCGNRDDLTFKFDGKLDSNPSDTKDGDASSISTLCKSAFEGTVYACRENEMVKKEIGKVTSISCTRSAGTIGYKLAGGKLTITVDPAYSKSNPSDQRDALVAKLRKDLDK